MVAGALGENGLVVLKHVVVVLRPGHAAALNLTQLMAVTNVMVHPLSQGDV